MSTIDAVLLALGQGQKSKGVTIAAIALLSSAPVAFALAVVLTLGSAR